jgi:hypothetical protein
MPNWSQIYRKAKVIFHWKHWVGTVTTLWVTGLGVGVGAYSPQVPVQAFYLAYGLLVAAFIWSVGAFLTSRFLNERKWIKTHPKKKKPAIKINTPRRFYAWAVGVSLLISVPFLGGLWLIWSTQVARQLSEMGGILIAANDPNPPHPPQCSPPPNALGIFYGTSATYFDGDSVNIFAVRVRDRNGNTQLIPFLQASRLPDGNIGLNADIRASDGKILVQVSNNEFYINDNKILRSFNPRPDRSTIRIEDEFGNQFRIRLLNRHSIRVSGKFFIGPNNGIAIEEDGDVVTPRNNRFGTGCSSGSKNVFVFE